MDDSTEIIRTLFEQHADAIYRYAKYSLPRGIDAKDVVQEVFLRAFQGWGDFNGKADPKTWLFKIARNYIYDLLRKKQRQRIYEANMPKSDGFAELDTMIELEDVLRRLKLSHRQVLNLRWIQGMTVTETAQVLGWSQSKVRLTFHRARKKLHELLQESSSGQWATYADGGGTVHGK